MGVAVSLATNESSASRAAANPGARGCRERWCALQTRSQEGRLGRAKLRL